MQTTVYSTTTDVKIHKAIRREWDGFLGWLVARQHELQLRGKTVKTAKLLAEARAQWLACVRARQLHLEHWVMTPEEKGAVQRALGWSQQEMVDAYAAEQEKMGAKYQRVDPTSFGEAGEVLRERFMHPPLNAEQPAYAHWAAEISSPSPGSSYRSPGKQPSVNNMSAELPNMPLYFVGALLRGTDLDAVAEAELEAFALGASEEKIREYYAEACEATVRFQRHIGGLPDDEQRDAATARFDDKMKKLAAEKAAEWKARVVKELRRYKAAQVEMRAAQYRATQMRPHTSPKTRTPRQQPSEWGYFSPQSWNGTTLSPYASPAAEGWGQQQSWGQGWGQTTDTNAWYNSPRGEPANMKEKKPKPKKEKPRQQQQQQQQQDPWGQPLPQQQPEPVSAFVTSPGLSRKNARREQKEYDYGDYWGTGEDKLGPDPDEYMHEESTGQRSWWTRWILGKNRRDVHEIQTLSSFDWIEPKAGRHGQRASLSRNDPLIMGKKPKENAPTTLAKEDWWTTGPGEQVFSEEEFPMRADARQPRSRWRNKLGWGQGKRRRIRSEASSDIGWATPSDDEE
ncbi:Sterol regulatory element binding protein cleavage-activating protein [Mycena kentingensis (nom. inval.)]|nr:Sterol regulatory element binding protein cleavage-activating protein [Mycena kentingensis (nom. inval.)]